jgi:DNA-binding transcriptional ArsR family regulator
MISTGTLRSTLTTINPPDDALDMPTMRRAAVRASNLLRVLANPDRLLLLCQLSEGECCVSELEGLLGIQQPTLSQQLGVLREEGLVETRREGKLIFYSICSDEALTVLNVLCRQFRTSEEKET